MNSLDSAKRMKQIFTVAGLILAFLLSLSVMIRWDESLRFISSVEFGATDPLFGRDISFYLLRLPFWDVLQSSLVSIVFIDRKSTRLNSIHVANSYEVFCLNIKKYIDDSQ